MSWAMWIAVALAVLNGGYMLFDGVRALAVGDYLTPSSGDHAGQLGPWANLVERLGINPRSTGMMVTFVGFGLAWLAMAAAYAFKVSWSWIAVVALGVGTLWYLVIGTAVSAAAIAFVLLERFWLSTGG